MITPRALIAVLFIAAISNVAFADPDKNKDGAKGTDSEPDCDYITVPYSL